MVYYPVVAESVRDLGGRFNPSLTNLERMMQLLMDAMFSVQPDVEGVYPDYLEAMVRLIYPMWLVSLAGKSSVAVQFSW